MIRGGSREQKELAGRLVVGLDGQEPTKEEWAWLQQWQPAGVILFSRNVQGFSQLQNLCTSLKTQLPRLQVMVDHEGGPVSQMGMAVGRPPVAFSLGILNDLDLTRRVHEETGRRLRSAGIDWVLGPCADVLTEKRNPVIGARAFGEDPEQVSRQVQAAVEGLRSAGISCCLKHWPGHGSSQTDSHLEATVVQTSPGDMMPFRAGLQAGAEAVMPGHLKTGRGHLPATLCPEFLKETREDLCPDGREILLIADDVSMGALRDPMIRLGVDVPGGVSSEMVEVAKLTLGWFYHLAEAGCDRFLIRGIPLGAFPLDGKKREWKTVRKPQNQPDFDETSYLEARKRCLPDFSGPQEVLVHLDLARRDRWQVAGGLGPDHWAKWDGILHTHFSVVLREDDLAKPVPSGGSVSFLLVTNHRPMAKKWATSFWAQSLKKRLGKSGRCLLMGHPSLEKEFEEFLGTGWFLSSLYDVSCDDLAPV
jgi:Glycosyl hydrolase family 3 N terminal domain